MNSKLRSSLIGLSALALVLTGTLYAPSQAAKKLPSNVSHTIQLDGSSNSKLNATQIASFRKKLVNASHLTKIDCVIRHAASISSGNLAKVTRAGQTACQSARKANPNLQIWDISFSESSRLKGTKFNLALSVYAPRTVSFQNTNEREVELPSNSRVLSFNGSYLIPDAPSTDVAHVEFLHWNSQPDGSGTIYLPGETTRIKHALTLYPYYEGHTINFNLVSLNTSVGSNYQLLYWSTSNSYLIPVLSASTSFQASTDENEMIVNLPGIMTNTTGFLAMPGINVSWIGAGTCPMIGAVADACTTFKITYTTSGTVTFNFEGYVS
jgi:hypothetical protein